MTVSRSLSLAAAAVLLAACTFGPRSAAPPPPETGVAPLPAAAVAPAGAVPPAPAVPPPAAEAATTPEAEAVPGPDGTVWIKPGMTSERYRADADNCYRFARGRVAHDARIEQDASAAFDRSSDGLGLSALRERMQGFERDQSLPRLFGDCMESKGYTGG